MRPRDGALAGLASASRAPFDAAMALSAFDDRQHPPTEADLRRVLGKAFPHWCALRERVERDHAPLAAEWGFASKSTGWGLRLKQDKRVALYLTPREGSFLASFALGEKAAKAAHDEGLPARVLAVIDAAPKYAEGRGVRFEVRTARDLPGIARLLAIRLRT